MSLCQYLCYFCAGTVLSSGTSLFHHSRRYTMLALWQENECLIWNFSPVVWLTKQFPSIKWFLQVAHFLVHRVHPGFSDDGWGGKLEGMRIFRRDLHFLWATIGTWGIAFFILSLWCKVGRLSRSHLCRGGFLGLWVTMMGTLSECVFFLCSRVSSRGVFVALRLALRRRLSV